MAQTITEELALIIKTQADQALEALKEYEAKINDVGEAAEGLADKQDSVDDATKNLSESQGVQIDSTDKLYNSYMKVVGAYAAAVAGVAKVIGVINEMREAGEANVLTAAKLQAVLDATGRSAEVSARQYGRWATDLRKATGVTEQEIMDMGAQLSVFGNIGSDILPEILERSIDLSKLWGEALPSSAKKLGRAIEDPLKGMAQLEESGVMLDAQTKANITSLMEAGRTADAQRILLDALEQRIGGVATSMRNALGPAGDFKTVLSEIKGEIGEDLLNIPGLELAVKALDSYLDGRKNKKGLKELFAADRDGDLQDVLAGMNSEDLQITLGLVIDSQSQDVAQTFRRNFDTTKQSIIDALMQQIDLQKQIDIQNDSAAGKAADQAASEKAIADALAAQKLQTTELQAAYATTEDGRRKALKTEIEALQKQQDTDLALIEAGKHDPEADIALTKEAQARVGLYKAVIEAKQKELDGLGEATSAIEVSYISKLFAGGDASSYILNIPVSYDFGRTSAETMQAELQSLKSQIEKVWSAGPAVDDTGEWQDNLDVLTSRYDDIKSALDMINKHDQQRNRAQELRDSLLSDEQKQQQKLATLKNELNELEYAGLLTHEERMALWDREYSKLTKIHTRNEKMSDEFQQMGKSLYEQFFKADAMGSTLGSTFASIGDSIALGESGLDGFSSAMGDFFQSITSQISSMAIAAGLRIIAEGGLAGLPAGLGLIALGGVTGIASGLMGGGKGIDESILDSMQDEIEARQKLAETINSSIDTEYELLKRQLDRNLISVEDFRSGASDLQSQRNVADVRTSLSDAISSQVSTLSNELSGMSWWDKLWSGRDEEINSEVSKLQSLFDSIDGSSVDELREIQATLKAMGVSLGSVPAFAGGGEFTTTGPRLILVGDNPGGQEHVKITPFNQRLNSVEKSVTNQQVVNLNGDIYGVEDLYAKLQQVGLKGVRRRS